MSHDSAPTSAQKLRVTLLVAAISLTASSCANVDPFVRGNSRTANCVSGGFLGAVTGALAGVAAKGDNKTIAGAAVVGGVAGCVAALSYKDRVSRLDEIARRQNLRIQTQTLQQTQPRNNKAQEVGLAVQVDDAGMFPLGSPTPSPEGARQIRALASAFSELDVNQAVLVIGHTDATGNAQANQQLSEQRARAVAGILAEQGIRRDRMYFQGAGAARPIADNANPATRGQNRRVEIVLVDNLDTLAKRVKSERNNRDYLAHGTSTEPAVVAAVAEKTPAPSTPATPKPAASAQTPAIGSALIDFGGRPLATSDWTLARLVTPKRSAISLIASAQASNLPMASCAGDTLRVSGEVKNLASGQVLSAPATREYLPGMNGRAWAGLANGHLVTVSPVSVLRDGAVVTQEPKVYITRDYEHNKGKTDYALTASANTFEGEDSILYRVFVGEAAQKPLHCLDVVLPKAGERSLGANLVYTRGAEPYAANLTLQRN